MSDEREALEKATWLLEAAAASIDEWFPNDEHPETQADLRRYAAQWQRQFGLRSAAEALAIL